LLDGLASAWEVAMGSNLSMLTILMLVEGGIAVCLVGLIVYRNVVSINEETELILDQAQAHFAKEQKEISERVERLSKPITFLSFAAGILALAIVGLWLYQGWKGSS
jgi:Tfp pilus assembly protein PilN